MTDPDALRPHELAVTVPDSFDAQLWFIGRIHTPWTRRGDCPHRGDPENGPDCRIEVFDPWVPGLTGIAQHEQVQVLYWMDRARRDLVLQNPRQDDGRALFGDAADIGRQRQPQFVKRAIVPGHDQKLGP